MPIEVTVTHRKVIAHGRRVSWQVRAISSLLGSLRTEILPDQRLGRMSHGLPISQQEQFVSYLIPNYSQLTGLKEQ